MILTYFLFAVGLALLVKGADIMVDGASSVAKRLGVSGLIIGLTIVSFGTSAPELIVNILASLNGSTDIAIGNILGSNIANILLILGISAVIYPIKVSRGTIWKEIPLALLAVIIMGIMANDALVDHRLFSELSRVDGIILISFLIIFLYYVFGIMKNNEEGPSIAKHSPLIASLMILGGLAGLTLGGKWVVDGAVALAQNFGVSEGIIGLSVVAIGTSLPELATSAVAAYKRHPDIAVGNIVGSNIFNIFWILGVSAIINPLPFSPEFLSDVFVLVGATVLLFVFMFIGRKHTLDRMQGLGFIALYVIYTYTLFLR
ncbi:MAG: calcium/sodium antiporter [bacterium]